MKEYVIKSFEELQSLIFRDCFDEKIGRYRNDFVYRGVSDKNYQLITKLQRICGHDLSLEESLIRNFMKYGYVDLQYTKSLYQKLAMGQHYGLPTRLLDWSYSPLVAAHFATENMYRYDCDGAIYCVNLEKANKLVPDKLRNVLEKERANTFTISNLDEYCPKLADFKTISDKPYFVFFEPGSQSDRISNQYALFSLVSDPSVRIDELLPDDEKVFYKIIIPKEIKLEIRDKLDYINISERFIYPGLDGICSWLSRRYANLKKEK